MDLHNTGKLAQVQPHSEYLLNYLSPNHQFNKLVRDLRNPDWKTENDQPVLDEYALRWRLGWRFTWLEIRVRARIGDRCTVHLERDRLHTFHALDHSPRHASSPLGLDGAGGGESSFSGFLHRSPTLFNHNSHSVLLKAARTRRISPAAI